MGCVICGDDQRCTTTRFWSPDDGWVIGKLCRECLRRFGNVRPRADDYAYDKRGEYVTDAESAIAELYG